MAKYGRPGKWDVGEPAIMRLPPHRHLNPCPCPFCNPDISRRKARLILHHGEVRGYPLTEPQRRFFGARASGYPRRNPMARRGYGAESLPAHYRSRSRRRHLPPMVGHKIVRGHYRHNPGGTNWLPIVAIAAGAFLLMRPGGFGTMFGGTSVMPAGYQYLGSGYYRGPDGQTYYRSPTTGQMAPVSAQQVAAGQLTQAGVQAGGQILTAAIPSIVQAGTSIFGSLASSIAGLFQTDQAPLVSDPYTGGSTGYADVLRSGSDVGYVPPPLPPLDVSGSIFQEMAIEPAPAPVGLNGTDQTGWW